MDYFDIYETLENDSDCYYYKQTSKKYNDAEEYYGD